MEESGTSKSSRSMVAKETLLTHTDLDSEMAYVRSSCVAAYYAEQFKLYTGKHLEFLPIHLYELSETDSGFPMEYFCGEEHLPGVFTKWTNNAAFISSACGTDVLESYSHYTYVASNEQLMVCDL